ncbi:MAG: MBL fold metallo-hydrolase [Gammaproteobacteria bacterium]|nr:MBL fold metallo-hydrolase [Gammaproteobacteria bacterium]
MQIASLGSGSKGNATLVRHGSTTLLVDCGFSLKQFERRLQRLDFLPEHIDAILVTHEHSDHSGGVTRLSLAFNIPVWATRGTARSAFDHSFSFNNIRGGHSIAIGDISVLPVTVPHDAREPVQYIFEGCSDGKKLGLLTDTGHITSHIASTYDGLHGLLLEFNYDEDMLNRGPYPFSIKQRVAGDLGHLSNEQSASLLRQTNTSQLNCLIAGHISENNNSANLVAQQLSQLTDIPVPILADQKLGFGWVAV